MRVGGAGGSNEDVLSIRCVARTSSTAPTGEPTLPPYLTENTTKNAIRPPFPRAQVQSMTLTGRASRTQAHKRARNVTIAPLCTHYRIPRTPPASPALQSSKHQTAPIARRSHCPQKGLDWSLEIPHAGEMQGAQTDFRCVHERKCTHQLRPSVRACVPGWVLEHGEGACKGGQQLVVHGAARGRALCM